jgi:mannosylglycoprotein endo-beta-mannosidase
MSWLFWNVRGMNDKGRREDIRKQIQHYKPSVVGLVETKVRSYNRNKIIRCVPIGWLHCDNYLHSNKGRIWLLWDSGVWNGTILKSSLQQISVLLENSGGLKIILSVIYGENREHDRVALWADLQQVHENYSTNPWLVIGDFNICRYTHEKIGGRDLSISKLQNFNDCLNNCGLTDLKSNASNWSWHNNQSGKSRIYAKLDRGLCNDQWLNLLPESHLEYKSSSTSDHNLMLVQLKPTTISGPKTFKFFNHWMSMEGFNDLLQTSWGNSVTGYPMFKLVTKLKGLKVILKEWASLQSNSTKYNIGKWNQNLLQIQQNLSADPFNEKLHKEEAVCKRGLEEWLAKEEEELRLKSRQLWLLQGDRNSKFFHNAIKVRISKNSLRGLLKDDGSSLDNYEIFNSAPSFYKTLFNQESYWNTFPKLVVKKFLTERSQSWLIREISTTEVKEALFQMEGDKAPGPDGFNASFYQHNWNTVGGDVTDVVLSFFKSGKLLKQVNHTFLALVPKSADSSSLNDFRPISCCNVLYKIIAKVLANRLKVVIEELISQNQHAFLKGRQIGECSQLAHELIRDFQKKHGKRSCIKLDLQKAFDSVNREFIFFIMHCMKFPYTWISWVRECIASPTFSLLINGSSTGYFDSNRGIRQGDPLSPYLFVMVMEFWSIHMDLATIKGSIQNYKRGRNLQISHLLFADDLLVFCRANTKSFRGLNILLKDLNRNTGLSMNKAKSKAYFSRGVTGKAALCSRLGVSLGTLPFKYLGIPLSPNYPKARNYLPLLDKLRAKFEGWMVHSLNFAGRLELIKTVIYGTISYWYLTYKFPISISKEIERICANFLWKGHLHSMRWEDVCKTKREGGFGLRSIQNLCDAAGVKKIWRLLNGNSMWSEWMLNKYLKQDCFWNSKATIFDSGSWKHLISLKEVALSNMRRKIGNGKDSFLWFDPWVADGRLVDLLGEELTITPGTELWKVSNIVRNGEWDTSSIIFNQFQASISYVCISETEDSWEWKGTTSGSFTLASAWDKIRERGNIFDLFNMVWFPYGSPKMSSCVLKAIKDRLPFRERLKRFGILQEDSCVLCSGNIETRDHLFFLCPFVSYIWSLCKLKMGIHSQNHGNLIQEASFIKQQFKAKDRMFILSRSVFQSMIWHIWIERNNRVFQNISASKFVIFQKIYDDVQIIAGVCDWEIKDKRILLANWGIDTH